MLTALLIGLAAGFLAGMLGIGGGFIFVPLMTHFHPELGLHGAMATSAGFAVCAGLSSYLSHRQHSALLGKLLAPIIAGGFCGALIGPRISLLLSDRVLALAFAGFVLLPYVIRLLRFDLKPSLPLLLFSGLVIGLASSLMGVGGGLLLIPLLIQGLKQEPRRVITTSALFVAINCTVATAGYSLAGQVDWLTLLIAGPAGVLAAKIGSMVSRRIPQRVLSFIMTGVLTPIILIRMLIAAFG